MDFDVFWGQPSMLHVQNPSEVVGAHRMKTHGKYEKQSHGKMPMEVMVRS